MLINLYLRLFSLFGQASVLLKQLLDFLQKSLTLLLNMLSFVSGYFFIPSNSSADALQSRLIFDINRNLVLSHDPPLLLLPLLSEKIYNICLHSSGSQPHLIKVDTTSYNLVPFGEYLNDIFCKTHWRPTSQQESYLIESSKASLALPAATSSLTRPSDTLNAAWGPGCNED